MDTKQCRRTLPDELVEKIISMLPFPSIAKARRLSKLWRARFSPLSTLEDPVAQQDALTFQKRVQESATNWSSFFPMCLDNHFLCGYDLASQKWVSFPSLSFLPEAFRSAGIVHWIQGALLYGMDWKNDTLYVANLLTRSWRRSVGLPPITRSGVICPPVSLWEVSQETYKVFYLQVDGDDDLYDADPFHYGFQRHFVVDKWRAQIYEPKSDVWSTKVLPEDQELSRCPVYLNGVVYMVFQDRLGCLLAINMAEGTLEELQLSFDGDIGNIYRQYLVVCNDNLHIVVIESALQKPLRVLEIDLESRRLLEVGTAPEALHKGGAIGIDRHGQPVSDGKCIFFAVAKLQLLTCSPSEKFPGQKVAYDVRTHEWAVVDFASKMGSDFKVKRRRPRNFKWIPCSFEPGLNPFAEV